MKVARQFIAWNGFKKGTVPEGTVWLGPSESFTTLSGERAIKPTQTVPYGTGLLLNPFQAINCLATFS